MINFIRKLQQSEEIVRRRLLYLGTAVSAFLIISLWIGYLNLTVPPLQSAVLEPARESASFWSVMERGLEKIKQQIEEGLTQSFFYFDRQLKLPRVFEISR
jgi:hypothetical protein